MLPKVGKECLDAPGTGRRGPDLHHERRELCQAGTEPDNLCRTDTDARVIPARAESAGFPTRTMEKGSTAIAGKVEKG